MMKYKQIILNSLLDKYERSKSFTGENKIARSIFVKITKLFPDYGDEAEFELLKDTDKAVAELEQMDFVTVSKSKNGIIDSVKLNIYALDSIYKYISRTPKLEINNRITVLLDTYSAKNELLLMYCNAQKERLAHNKKVEFFDNDISEYEMLLKALSVIFDVEEETYIRDFSVRALGDSKAFEKIKGKLVRLLFKYGDFPNEETILEELNIIKNPGHVYIKGNAVISLCGQTIDLSVLDGDIAVSSKLLSRIDSIEVKGGKVMTIENLTTFNSFRDEDTFAIYLGGYHNSHRRNFIKKVYAFNSDAEYYHYGDIDAGGFYILLHLRAKTGVYFKPYQMDIDALKKYADQTAPLTDNDKKRLKNLLNGDFSETVEYMLKNNCKLEQEALD